MDKEQLKKIWNSKYISKSHHLSDLDYSHLDHEKMSGRQILWHLINDVSEIPLCKNQNCSNSVKWHKNDYAKYCSTYCMNTCITKQQKVKKTLLKKYGVSTPFLSNEVIDKSKKTKKQRYDDEHYNNREKAKKTNLERYGAETPFGSEYVRNKIKQINTDKYGVSQILSSKIHREKATLTIIDRYGVPYPQQNIDIRKKTTSTVLKKYGALSTFESNEIKSKIKKTMLERYGVETPFESDIIKQKAKETLKKRYGSCCPGQACISNESLKILDDPFLFANLVSEYTVKEISEILNVNLTTVYDRIHRFNLESVIRKTSYLELEIKSFIENIQCVFLSNSRSIISPKELDFYLPEYKLAIEMNGDYWHSHEKLQDVNYHYNKWQRCQEQGIQLIQILESDWNQSADKFKSLILSCLGKKPRGDPARKCQIRQIDAKTARPFLDQYHLQGFVSGTSHWGAYDSRDQLVAVMTFGWTRGSKQSRRFELKRWVTDNQSHAGLFSKTFKFAQKTLNFDQAVSFSANDWFTGDVYEKCGFMKGKQLPPSYSYLYKNKKAYLSNFTKQRIKERFPEIYDENLTEREMMENLSIPRIYDSGKTEWIWINI